MKYIIIGLIVGITILLGLNAFAQSSGPISHILTEGGRLLGIGPGLTVNAQQQLEVVFPPAQKTLRTYNEPLTRVDLDTFTFANPFVAGTEQITRNGVTVFVGLDYNVVDATTIQFVPLAGMTADDSVFASYDRP